MRHAWSLFLLSLLAVLPARGQDTARYTLRASSTGLLNRTTDAQSYVLTNTAAATVTHRRYGANVSAGYVYGESRSGLTNNDFTATATGNRYARNSRRIYLWGLGSYETSYALRVQYRVQAGAGIAWSPVDRDRAYLNFSDGPLYERSRVTTPDGLETDATTARNSFRLRFRFATPGNKVVLDGTHFLQTSLHDISDYLIRSSTTLTVAVWKGVGITAAANYNRATTTNRETLLLTLGIQVSHSF